MLCEVMRLLAGARGDKRAAPAPADANPKTKTMRLMFLKHTADECLARGAQLDPESRSEPLGEVGGMAVSMCTIRLNVSQYFEHCCDGGRPPRLRKDVSAPMAADFMDRARTLVASAPLSGTDMCASLSWGEITAIERFEQESTEKNGPDFYAKLLGFFIPEAKGLCKLVDDLTRAKHSLEAAWAYRTAQVFMTQDCKMLRESLKEALTFRKSQITEAEKKAAEEQARQQALDAQAQAALANPATVMQLMQNPTIQTAVFAAVQQLLQGQSLQQQPGQTPLLLQQPGQTSPPQQQGQQPAPQQQGQPPQQGQPESSARVMEF